MSHALREMIEEDLVIKTGKGYDLGNLGNIQKSTQEWMGRTLDASRITETSS